MIFLSFRFLPSTPHHTAKFTKLLSVANFSVAFLMYFSWWISMFASLFSMNDVTSIHIQHFGWLLSSFFSTQAIQYPIVLLRSFYITDKTWQSPGHSDSFPGSLEAVARFLLLGRLGEAPHCGCTGERAPTAASESATTGATDIGAWVWGTKSSPTGYGSQVDWLFNASFMFFWCVELCWYVDDVLEPKAFWWLWCICRCTYSGICRNGFRKNTKKNIPSSSCSSHHEALLHASAHLHTCMVERMPDMCSLPTCVVLESFWIPTFLLKPMLNQH